MNEYLQYNVNELAGDEQFISWARGNADTQSNKDWAYLLQEHPGISDTIQKAKKLVLSIQFEQSDDVLIAQRRVWKKIQDNTSDNAIKNTVFSMWKLKMALGAVAAAVLLVFVAYSEFTSDYDNDIRTSLAEVQQISLPDGSQVKINAGSRLQYNAENWNETREVYLRGEAFFDVRRGSKFSVKTNDGTVAVLGTSFNIYTRDHIMEVICRTGKVSVSTNDEEVILSPNEAVKVSSRRLGSKTDDNINDSRDLWVKGMYNYNNAKIGMVFDDIERQFDVELKYPQNIKEMIFTGSYNGNDLEKVLYQVCWPLKLDYTIKDGSVVIKDTK